MNKDIIANMVLSSARNAILENVDSINDTKILQKELKEHLKKEFDLQHQLKEKDKIINEILNYPYFTGEMSLFINWRWIYSRVM